MKFICQKAVLSGAVSTSCRAVSQKNAIPALEGILINASSEYGLRLSSYNLEIGIITYCPADIVADGSAIINARLLSDIIRKLPDESIIFEKRNESSALIKCGPTEFNIPVIDASEFPEMPTVENEDAFSMKQQTLKNMINKTVFATAQNDIKPILTGLCFDIAEGMINIIAIDNYRMALRKEPIVFPDGNEEKTLSFILPGTTARELEKILDENDDDVSITLSKKKICFTIGETTVISRLLEGKYYNYKSFIPKKGTIITKCETSKLYDAVERVSLIINERLHNHIRLSLEENVIKLSCTSSLGNASDEIYIQESLPPLEIGFNNKIFLDALKAIEEENVELEFSSSIQPCVIRPEGSEKYIQIIMPVRLKNN